MTIRSKTLPFILFLLILFGSAPVYPQTTVYDIHKEIPLRFNYRAAATGGTEKESGWIWLGGVVESNIYFSKMNVPVALSFPGKMIIQCSKNDIYTLPNVGNQAPCRGWIESRDDPDVPELSSNYGYTLGVKFRDIFTETELADVGKDFALKINGNGPMPMGDNRICGIDYLEFASFPVSQFIPDTKVIQKVAKKIVGSAGIGKVRLAGELVIEGNYVALHIADASIKFYGFRNAVTYPDPASDPNVMTFALTVPSAAALQDSPRYNAESKTLFYEPVIQYSLNLYNTAGLDFSLIGPLKFNFMPTVLTNGTNVMSYSCPDALTLHNGHWYNKAADDFKISTQGPVILSFPLTDTPNLPDIAITEVRFNNIPDGEVFADEWTAIDFTITNIGERDTVVSPEPLFTYSLFFNGQYAPDPLFPELGYPMQFRWLDDVPQDTYKTTLVSLPKNASHRVGAFVYKFKEGPFKLEISTGYNEYKTTQNGQPVYGVGDYKVDNNYRVARQFYVQPKRGTVLGRIITNPCGGDCGVNGIQVCLKDAAAGGYYECQTTRNISGREGAYRFEAVPTSDYTLEYRPTPLTGNQIDAGTLPYWAPRSFSFHHDGADTDDFNYNTLRSGMAIFQYQTLKGYVYDQNNQPIQGATVQLGIAGVGPFGPSVMTNVNGLFAFTRGLPIYDGNGELISGPVPLSENYAMDIRHDLYQPKEIQFRLSVTDSSQTETVVTSFYFDPDVDPNGSTSGPVKLTLDTTAPTIEVHPLASGGYAGSSLNLQFLASDTNGKTIKQYRHTVYYGAEGTAHGTPSAWISYPEPDAANPDVLVAATVAIGAPLADGPHRLYLEVSDGRNVTGRYIPFTKDTVAPVISSLKLKDPVSQSEEATNSKFVEAVITISNVETGKLAAYLSNDNASWSDPFYFTCTATPCTTTIGKWQVLFKDATSSPETKTVYAKVMDAAGNVGTGNDTITVDTTGAVVLANGAIYFNNYLNVPLAINITPPAGVVKYVEGYGSFTFSMTLGDTTATQYRAQPLITNPASSITFNQLELWMGHIPVIGTPGRLHVRIVSQLSSSDPASSSYTLAEWSAPAGEVSYSLQRYGYCFITLPHNVTVNTDGTAYVLIYTENADAGNYYGLSGGYYMTPSPNKRQDFVPGTGWVGQNTSTLPFRLYDTSTGEIRIANDGVCDTETWQPYAVNAIQGVNFPAGNGTRNVCVGYWHPSFGNRSTAERKYYDSVIINTTNPTGTVAFRSLERASKTLYLDLAAYAPSGVESLVWKAGGTWTLPEPYSTTLVIPNLAVDTVEVKFIDRAGNESTVYTVTLPEDIFEPLMGPFRINDGSGYTTDPQVTFHVSATDNRSLAGILYTETVTGTKGKFDATGTSYSPDPPLNVALPKTKVNDAEVWIDGVYQYALQALDAAGNRSMARKAAVTLDRQAPTIRHFYLRGLDGRAMTKGPIFEMILNVRDAFGPLKTRRSFNQSVWTEWQAIDPGETVLRIDAPTPMPAAYTLYVEVKDGAGNTTAASARIPTNRPPAAPVGGSPIGKAFTDGPRIEPTPFFDADGDTQEALWILVRKTDDQSIVINTMPLYGITGYSLPPGDLSYDVSYNWSARYLDSFGQWSSWSSPVYFVLKRPTLTVLRNGSGRVESTGTGIACDDTFRDCSEICAPGAQVNLIATPSPDFVFTGWSGGCSGTGSCRIFMDADKTVTASFEPAAATLRGDVDHNRKVDLADAVAALQVMAGLLPAAIDLTADVNGDGKIGVPEALYVLQVLSAIREAYLPVLTVVKSGNGTGTITSTPQGIACGSDCSETYRVATSLELTAMPDAGSTFGGWVGSCSGSGSCMLTVDAVHTVGALFNLKRWTIAASAGPGGSISPSGNVTVDHGAGLTFTITPSVGYHVANVLVDGVSVGAGASYGFADVAAGHTIAASFERNADTFVIMAEAGANGAISPSGNVSIAAGGNQTFTITPEAGYHVAQVFVDGNDVGPVTAYTFKSANANRTIRASFEANVVFEPGDLAGAWQLAGIATGKTATAPYAVVEFDADARIAGGLLTYPESKPQNVKGALSIDKQGRFSGDVWDLGNETLLTILSGKVTETRNFLTFAGRSNRGTFELMTAMKDGTALIPRSSADLSGTWQLFGFRTGDGAGPLKGTLTLDSEGNVAADSSLTPADKPTTWIKGSIQDGLEAPPDMLRLNSGQIDNSRKLMTFTDAGKSAHDFFLAAKDGAVFPQGLLEGTWHVTGIDAGDTWHGMLHMSGEGVVSKGALTDGKDQETPIQGGQITMNTAGEITGGSLILEGGSILNMDAGRMAGGGNMIFWIMRTPSEAPGLMILIRERDER